MALRVGAPAEGDDFFNRKVERAQLWRVLTANHVVLTAPRRVGKTSLLKVLAHEAAAQGLLAIYLDLSPCTDAAALLQAIDAALPEATLTAYRKQAAAKVGEWFARIGKVRLDAGELGGLEIETRPTAPTPWADTAAALRKRLSGQPVLIVLDEFSVFLQRLLVHDRAQAVTLLSTLRSWRQQSALVCRFIFSGSIGLNRLLERHGLHTETNDCYDYTLQAFATADAAAMLAHFSQREGWPLTDADAQGICQRVGWLSPFYLMVVLEESIQAAMQRLRVAGPCGQALSAADIDQGFAQLIDARSRFSHWYRRLDEHFSELDLAFARAALRRIAQRPNGLLETTLLAPATAALAPANQASLQAETLSMLEEHGYLVLDGQRLMFQSPLLRQYWKKHHGR